MTSNPPENCSRADGRSSPPISLDISVIVPSFNRKESTKRAVRSALAQSRAPLEVIVVDDGSADPIDRDQLGIDDARVRIVRLDRNCGPSTARRIGIEAANGNVLAFLDSDDVWLPHKLASQIEILADSDHEAGLIAVVCGWITTPEGAGSPEMIVPRESRNPSDFAAGCWFAPGSTLLVPRRVFDVVGPFDPDLRRLEDYEWFLRFALAGGRVVVEPSAAAIVSVGRRGRTEDVRHAKNLIEGRLATLHHPAVGKHFRRMARAYLCLEMAKSAQNQDRLVLMGFHLLQSLLLKPRGRPALNQWWTVRRKLPNAGNGGAA